MFLSLQVHFDSAHSLSSTTSTCASPTRTQVIPAVLYPVLRIQITYSSATHWHTRYGFSLGMLRQRFSRTDASVSIVCVFFRWWYWFFFCTVQKQQAFESRILALRLRLSRAGDSHHLAQLPALSYNVFRSLHYPNSLSAGTAVAGLHSTSST